MDRKFNIPSFLIYLRAHLILRICEILKSASFISSFVLHTKLSVFETDIVNMTCRQCFFYYSMFEVVIKIFPCCRKALNSHDITLELTIVTGRISDASFAIL